MKSFIREFQKGMKSFADNLAILVNTILLFIVYLTGIGLTSITARIFRKKFLDIKNSNQETYWSDLNLRKKELKHYYRQF